MLLVARCSLLAVRCSLLAAGCSLLADRCFGSVFVPKVDFGDPKITENDAQGSPGEVPGEPRGAENQKFERRRNEEQITLL